MRRCGERHWPRRGLNRYAKPHLQAFRRGRELRERRRWARRVCAAPRPEPRGLGGWQKSLLSRQPDQRRLQLLERADFDLADAFAAYGVDLRKLLKGLGLVGQAPFGED